jgi:hypothetical protein
MMSRKPQAHGRMGARRYFTKWAEILGLTIVRRRGKVWYFIGGVTTPTGTPRTLCLRWYKYKLVHQDYDLHR